MNSGAPRSGIPTFLIAILASCGGCVLITIIAVVIGFSFAMNSPPVTLGRATVLQNQKRYKEAEALLESAAKKSPRDAEVLNDLAWTYYLDGQYTVGEPYAVRAVALNNDPSNIDTLAHIHLGLERYDEAEKEFQTALSARPNIAESLDGLGQVYERRGQYDKALHEYRLAIDADPNIEGTQERIDRLVQAGHGGKPKSQSKKKHGQ